MNQVARRPGRLHLLLWTVQFLWLALLGAVACSRFASSWAWRIDLVANLSYFIAVPALLTAVVFFAFRRWRSSILAIVIVLVAAWPVRHAFLPALSKNVVTDDDRPVRILLINVHDSPSAIGHLADLLVREKPDAAIAIEVGPGLETRLVDHPEVKEIYPFALTPQPGQAWRTIMLSRYPMHRIKFDRDKEDSERYRFVYAFQRSVFVDSPAGRFLLSADHPVSPRTAATWQRGNKSVELLAEVSKRYLFTANAPIVIAGDFNTTAAGWRFRILNKRSGLKPSDRIGALAGTWPSALPGLLRLTIDRLWVSPDVEFVSRKVLADIGSDHRPILVTLRMPPPRGDQNSGQPEGEDGR